MSDALTDQDQNKTIIPKQPNSLQWEKKFK